MNIVYNKNEIKFHLNYFNKNLLFDLNLLNLFLMPSFESRETNRTVSLWHLSVLENGFNWLRMGYYGCK